MSERHEITVRAVVVGHRLAGEGSLRISLYTDALGLVYVFAKSAREERSKLRAHLTEGTYGTYTLVNGGRTWRVTGAVATQNVYFFPSASPTLREMAARVISMVRQFVRGEGSDPYLFSVLWSFLDAAPRCTLGELSAMEAVTTFRLLSALGYVSAGKPLESFLETSYSTALLTEAHKERTHIVRAVNEGIAASGL